MKRPTAILLKVLKRTNTSLDAVYRLDPPLVDRRQPEIAILYVRVVSSIDIMTGIGSVRVYESNDQGGTLSMPLNPLRGSKEGSFDHGFALYDAGYESVMFTHPD